MLKPRNIGIAFALAALVFAGAIVWLFNALPAQGVYDTTKDYGYVYSGTKSNSTAFTASSMEENDMVVFGSSELSTPPRLIPQVPTVVFGTNEYGIDLTYVGEAYDQSLWQGIAAGAYAENLDNKKVAIIVSPSWFVDGGLDNDLFGTRFSYSLYREFCNNDTISDTSKAYLKKRLLEQGISESTVAAGLRELPQDWLNDALYAASDDLRLRQGLEDVRQAGLSPREVPAATPNFEAVRAQGAVDGEQGSTNNDWGIDDAYWTQNLEGRLDLLKDTQIDESFSDTPEYDDFGFLLRVCQEAGLEPLIVVSPVNGPFYDHVGITAETRGTCYERIASIADAYGVSVADFSDKEYERYFLHDIVHFGWTGWVDVEQALYEFAKGER